VERLEFIPLGLLFKLDWPFKTRAIGLIQIYDRQIQLGPAVGVQRLVSKVQKEPKQRRFRE